MAVDIARRPYTTRARFFRDDDREIKIKWVPADPGRGTFPGVSHICSLDWVTHPETAVGVGEVFGASRNYNRGKPFTDLVGNHFCGTLDEHRNGEVFDPTRPPMLYNPSGLPLCCDPDRREADVRLSVAISTRYTAEGIYRSSVRVVAAPATFEVRSDPYTSSGRVAFSFSVFEVRSDPYHSSLFLAVELATSTEDTPAYFSRPMVAITMDSHYTSSVPCADLADTALHAPLTYVDRLCSYLLPNFSDAVLVFPIGWRQYEVTPDTDYRFLWDYLTGLGISGTYDLWRGDETGPIVLVHSDSLVGANGSFDFNSSGSDRVFVFLDEPHSDTSEDVFQVEVETL